LTPTWQLVLAVALFAVSVGLSRGSALHTWEEELYLALYNTPAFLRPLFFVVTQAGTVYAFGVLLLLFVLLQRYHSVLRLLLTGILAYLLAGFAKSWWGRERPHELLGLLNLDYTVYGPGFPSGHVALATALAFTAGRYLPKRFRWVV